MTIKTKFSKHGMLAVILVFLPYVFAFFPSKYPIREELVISPKPLVVMYFISLAGVILASMLVENISALPFSRKSRIISLAYIFLGIDYILWVYFYIGRANTFSLLSIEVLGSAYLTAISVDRKNWVAIPIVVIHLALGISMTVITYCV